MAIGMIEFQGSIQRTQDYTAIKQQENNIINAKTFSTQFFNI